MSDFKDNSGTSNPIFKIMNHQAINKMPSNATEDEIKKHKDKLKDLISRLNNTHNIDEEYSINNEIRNETEILSSLFIKKRNELNQNNNMGKNDMNSNNNFLNPPFNQNNMNIINNDMNNNIMNCNQMQLQQQALMFQQEMMQKTIMQQQAIILEMQEEMKQNLIERQKKVDVTFHQGNHVGFDVSQIKCQCSFDDKVSSMIEKYRNLSGDMNSDKKFIFNTKSLVPALTLAESGFNKFNDVFVI